MKPLNKNSWLYRLNYKFGTRAFILQAHNKSVSLCTLATSTVMCVVYMCILTFLTLVGVIGITICVLSLLSPVMLLTGYVPSFMNITFHYELLIGLLVITLMFGFIAVVNGDMKIVPEYMKRNKLNTPTKPKYSFKDSYIYNYIKSRKDKFCPMIDIE